MSHIRLSLISPPASRLLTHEFLTDLKSNALAACTMGQMRVLSLDHAVEIELATLPDNLLAHMRERYAGQPIDINLLTGKPGAKRLILADMDSTMIEQECIDELAATLGIKSEIAAITERAMAGELSFEEALISRIKRLHGLSEETIKKTLRTHISAMPGGATLIATMKHHGAFAALVSGGFTHFTAPVSKALGFDTHRANQLAITNGGVSGVDEPILGREAKAQFLNRFADERGIALEDCMAVGDGANDLMMINAAGLGVAYHAKPVVADEADASIQHNDLSALLYLQGLSEEDIIRRDDPEFG